MVTSLLLASSCLTTTGHESLVGAPRTGIDDYSLQQYKGRSDTGCRFAFRRYRPAGTALGTFVIGHGFLRHQRTMSGLATALATRGYEAVTVEFCNMHWWKGNHVQNAADMQALVRRLGIRQPVYAGFSAGALAALIAAANDPSSAGLLTLDLVDQASLGRDAAGILDVPWLALHGDASSCNADNNAMPAYSQAHRLDRLHVEGAAHCEFESPTNRLCEWLCGDDDGAPVNDRQRRTIIEQIVAGSERFRWQTAETADIL